MDELKSSVEETTENKSEVEQDKEPNDSSPDAEGGDESPSDHDVGHDDDAIPDSTELLTLMAKHTCGSKLICTMKRLSDLQRFHSINAMPSPLIGPSGCGKSTCFVVSIA